MSSLNAEQVVPLLLTACPSFEETWQTMLADDADAPDATGEPTGQRLHYPDAGQFARHLVGLMREGQTAELVAVFSVIERLHVEGDDYVRELATVGYLEGIQNVAGWDPVVQPKDFEPYLQPESRRYWRLLNEFWAGA